MYVHEHCYSIYEYVFTKILLALLQMYAMNRWYKVLGIFT